jgi:hypothetical protein
MHMPSVMTDSQRRRTAFLAAAVLACVPVVAEAAPQHGATAARSDVTIALGNVYGGVTPQLWPVIVEVNNSHRKITRIVAGLRLQCTSGDFNRISDGYVGLRIKRNKFGASFGPEVDNSDDGTTITHEGTMGGKFSQPHTKASGTWTYKMTFKDASGTVTDTCDSGIVNWSAKN